MNIAKEYLTQLEERFGKTNDIHKIGCEDESKPEIDVYFFEDLPEGLLTAITLGLSNAKMEEWKYASPELIITLDTKDKGWGLCAGYFISSFFKEKLFTYGSLFSLDTPISEESKMTSFFTFAPSFLKQDEATFELSDRKIILSGMYPLYSEEILLYQNIGLEEFWHLDGFDMYNVNRKNLAI